MFKWVGGLLDRICAVIGAIVFVQIPLFINQYTQQLIGREAELHSQVNAMKQAASLSGKTLEQFTQKFLTNSDVDFIRQGEIMQAMVTRWQSLVDALSALQTSSAVGRPFMFFTHLNAETLQSTFKNYTFGFPFTLEGGIYALVGILLGYSLFSGLRRFVLMFKRKPKQTPQS